MNKYEKGIQILDERFGHFKDNVIALATIDLETSDNKPRPRVRDVDAYYESGVFYISTYALSNKMKQIALNDQVAISANFEDFHSSGIAKNLGWVLDPSNAELRLKLRQAFANWYDFANNESDPNCCILAVYLTEGTLRIDHGVEFYHFDFINKQAS